MKQGHLRIIMLFSVLYSSIVSGQRAGVDSAYIHLWKKPNVIELYPGVYKTHFTFSRPDDFKNNYRLVANSSGYMGVYLNYKWLSLEYSWTLPGTQLDKKIKVKNTSLGYRFNTRNMMFRPFYESLSGLLIPDKKSRHHFNAFPGIQLTRVGTDIYYYTNTRRFSFSAANYFSAQQVKSAGALVIMATPSLQSIGWNKPSRRLLNDSATYQLLASNMRWVSLLTRLGYNYNFILDEGKWSFSPGVLAGVGALSQIHAGNRKFQPVTDFQAWVNAGYNGPQYYVYFNASLDDCQTSLFIKTMQRTNIDVSLTSGYRFGNSKKKILGIL